MMHCSVLIVERKYSKEIREFTRKRKSVFDFIPGGERQMKKQLKRKIALVLAFFMAVGTVAGCGKKENNDTPLNSEVEEEVDEKEEKMDDAEEEITKKSGDVIFSTEYTIEKYCHGRFIVSKSDGLLYGVLDMDGKEVIPVKYDEIQLMNKDALLDGVDSEAFFRAQYEETYRIFDENGNEILGEDARYIDYPLGGVSNDLPRFYRTKSTELDIYDGEGKNIAALTFEGEADSQDSLTVSDVAMVSENICAISYEIYSIDGTTTKYKNAKVLLCDINKDSLLRKSILKEWNDTMCKINTYNGTVVLEMTSLTGEGESSYAVTKDGGTKRVEVVSDKASNSWNLGENKLYQTNDTWKLIDKEGKPIYDERYYERYTEDGTYFLENEDRQFCLIDRWGNMIADYGVFVCENNSVYYDGSEMTDENYFAGDDGVCIVKNSNEGNQVRFFYCEEPKFACNIIDNPPSNGHIEEPSADTGNLVQNPGFETGTMDMWEITNSASYDGEINVLETSDSILKLDGEYVNMEDAFGSYMGHFWSENEQDFMVTQQINAVFAENGIYSASMDIEGGDVGDSADIYLCVWVGEKIYTSEKAVLTGGGEWKHLVIDNIPITTGDSVKVGLCLKCAANGWGMYDNFELIMKQQ